MRSLCAGIALGAFFFHRGQGDTSAYSYHKGERTQTERVEQSDENAHGGESREHGADANPWRR